MLASMPSQGTDWLAECIVRSHPDLRYCREYFSPMCNWKRSQILSQALGDTLYGTTGNLCRYLVEEEIDVLLDLTWRRDSYNFTKENYLAFQLEQFSESFTVIALLRRFQDTFPPRRHRVMRWYEHFYWASWRSGKHDSWCDERSRTPMEYAVIGYYWFARELIRTSERIGAPLLWMHDLVLTPPEGLADILGPLPIDRSRLADEILETRQNTPRPGGEYREQWKDAISLYEQIEERFGSLAELSTTCV